MCEITQPQKRCVVLDNRERQLLFEIERRLLIDDPELVRSFGAAPQRRTADHGQGIDMITTVAGLTLCVVLLMGPRLLTEPEIATRRSAGPPLEEAETTRSPRSRFRPARFRARRGDPS